MPRLPSRTFRTIVLLNNPIHSKRAERQRIIVGAQRLSRSTNMAGDEIAAKAPATPVLRAVFQTRVIAHQPAGRRSGFPQKRLPGFAPISVRSVFYHTNLFPTALQKTAVQRQAM